MTNKTSVRPWLVDVAIERAEQRARRFATVCSWCPDAQEQTESARANGFDVTHTICSACAARFERGEKP